MICELEEIKREVVTACREIGYLLQNLPEDADEGDEEPVKMTPTQIKTFTAIDKLTAFNFLNINHLLVVLKRNVQKLVVSFVMHMGNQSFSSGA
jgi:hypothetical protein